MRRAINTSDESIRCTKCDEPIPPGEFFYTDSFEEETVCTQCNFGGGDEEI